MCFLLRVSQQDATSQIRTKPVGSKQGRRTKGPKAHEPGPAPERPTLATEPSRFMQMEREIVAEFRPKMLAELSTCPALANTAAGYAERPQSRPLTKFEARGLKLGHRVWDLVFVRR